MPIAPDQQHVEVATKADVLVDVAGAVKEQQNLPTEIRTIIFLDWDDTLLCSTVLSQAGVKLNSDFTVPVYETLRAQLEVLSDTIVKLLETALLCGEVHVVTNGETGWVEMSAQKFVPRVLPLLEKVQVVSARSTYEQQFPNDPMKWKFQAFGRQLGPLFISECVRNVLSFGDSHSERQAIRALTKDLPYTLCKSIKFIERPTVQQLLSQLQVALSSLEALCVHDGHLDLRLAPAANDSAADPPADALLPGTVC